MTEPESDNLPNADKSAPQTSATRRKPLGGLLSGFLACGYCVIAGGLSLGGGYNFFVNTEASIVAMFYGVASILLLMWQSQRPSVFIYLLGRNLSIAFALVLVIQLFAHSMPPGFQLILRVVLQLAVVWIIFSTFRILKPAL